MQLISCIMWFLITLGINIISKQRTNITAPRMLVLQKRKLLSMNTRYLPHAYSQITFSDPKAMCQDEINWEHNGT